MAKTIIHLKKYILPLCLHHYSSNMYYASFMIIPDSAEELRGDYDDMSCITRETGTVGTSFGNAVDEAKSEFQTKQSAPALGHLQDYMDAISREPGKWEGL